MSGQLHLTDMYVLAGFVSVTAYFFLKELNSH